MNGSRMAIAAGVTVLAVAAVGIFLMPPPGASPDTDPTPTSLYRSEPDLLPSGAYVIDKLFERPITLELPGNWTGLEHSRGQAVIIKTVDAQPFGTVDNSVLLGIYAVDSVYADPCHDTKPVSDAPTSVDGFVTAFTRAFDAQPGPVADTTVGGRGAKVFDLRNAVNADHCRSFHFSQWSFRNESGVAQGNGTSSGGSHQRIWLLDLDGTIILVDADSGEDAFPDDTEELYRIVESIRFE
jgi:hypothetical protein